MLFSGVHHVAIIVQNMDLAKEFYVGKLGLLILDELLRPAKNSSILYLDAGNVILELFDFATAPPRFSYPEALGLRHLALRTENFDSTLMRLQTQGVVLEAVRQDERTQKRMTFLQDPFGLPIEICEV